ncbi:LPXTG cell wall anchor domain-containing protein, partial [Cellulomonas rhizosphaerae]
EGAPNDGPWGTHDEPAPNDGPWGTHDEPGTQNPIPAGNHDEPGTQNPIPSGNHGTTVTPPTGGKTHEPTTGGKSTSGKTNTGKTNTGNANTSNSSGNTVTSNNRGQSVDDQGQWQNTPVAGAAGGESLDTCGTAMNTAGMNAAAVQPGGQLAQTGVSDSALLLAALGMGGLGAGIALAVGRRQQPQQIAS